VRCWDHDSLYSCVAQDIRSVTEFPRYGLAGLLDTLLERDVDKASDVTREFN
jgi:hypothetical protein